MATQKKDSKKLTNAQQEEKQLEMIETVVKNGDELIKPIIPTNQVDLTNSPSLRVLKKIHINCLNLNRY